MEIPKFMRFGWFGAYGEGWAHYTETLGPEFGLYTILIKNGLFK